MFRKNYRGMVRELCFYRQLTVTGRPFEIPLNKHFTHKIGNKSRLFPTHNQNLVKGLRPAMRLNILYQLIHYTRTF